MKELIRYNNGNTIVTILEDGTKYREYEGEPWVQHPESIDIKITDYCNMGCKYCHESSTIQGKHGDLHKLKDILNELPSGVELALGGGNPLSHPDLESFLIWCKEKEFIINLTVNQGHIKSFGAYIETYINQDLIKGLGISITNNNFDYIKHLKTKSDNIVYHIIAGVNNITILDKLIELGNTKILILGYKHFGFGVNYYSKEVKQSLAIWYQQLPKYIGKSILSFDNLAIEQLNIKRLFTNKGWEKFYMGDDFVFTQYIDAVKQEYAPTSRSNKRTLFNKKSLLEYFTDKF